MEDTFARIIKVANGYILEVNWMLGSHTAGPSVEPKYIYVFSSLVDLASHIMKHGVDVPNREK